MDVQNAVSCPIQDESSENTTADIKNDSKIGSSFVFSQTMMEVPFQVHDGRVQSPQTIYKPGDPDEFSAFVIPSNEVSRVASPERNMDLEMSHNVDHFPLESLEMTDNEVIFDPPPLQEYTEEDHNNTTPVKDDSWVTNSIPTAPRPLAATTSDIVEEKPLTTTTAPNKTVSTTAASSTSTTTSKAVSDKPDQPTPTDRSEATVLAQIASSTAHTIAEQITTTAILDINSHDEAGHSTSPRPISAGCEPDQQLSPHSLREETSLSARRREEEEGAIMQETMENNSQPTRNTKPQEAASDSAESKQVGKVEAVVEAKQVEESLTNDVVNSSEDHLHIIHQAPKIEDDPLFSSFPAVTPSTPYRDLGLSSSGLNTPTMLDDDRARSPDTPATKKKKGVRFAANDDVFKFDTAAVVDPTSSVPAPIIADAAATAATEVVVSEIIPPPSTDTPPPLLVTATSSATVSVQHRDHPWDHPQQDNNASSTPHSPLKRAQTEGTATLHHTGPIEHAKSLDSATEYDSTKSDHGTHPKSTSFSEVPLNTRSPKQKLRSFVLGAKSIDMKNNPDFEAARLKAIEESERLNKMKEEAEIAQRKKKELELQLQKQQDEEAKKARLLAEEQMSRFGKAKSLGFNSFKAGLSKKEYKELKEKSFVRPITASMLLHHYSNHNAKGSDTNNPNTTDNNRSNNNVDINSIGNMSNEEIMSTVMPLAKLVALNNNNNGQTANSSGTSIFSNSNSGRNTPNSRNKRMSIIRTTKPQTNKEDNQESPANTPTFATSMSTRSLLVAEQDALDQQEMERFLQELQSEELIEKRFGWNRRQKLLLSASLDDIPSSPTTITNNSNNKSTNHMNTASDSSLDISRKNSVAGNASRKSSFSRSFRAVGKTTTVTKNAADFIPAFDDEYNPHSIFDHYSGFIYRDPAIPVAWKDAFLDTDQEDKKNASFSYAKRALRAGHMINCYRPWGKEKPQDDLTMLVRKTLASASVHENDDNNNNNQDGSSSLMSGSSFLFEKPNSANRRGLLQQALMGGGGGGNLTPGSNLENNHSLSSSCDNSVVHHSGGGHPHAQFIQEHDASLDGRHSHHTHHHDHDGRHKSPGPHRGDHHQDGHHESHEKRRKKKSKKHIRQPLVINIVNQSLPGSATL